MSFHPKMAYDATFHKSTRTLAGEGAPFVYSAENRARLDAIVRRYPPDRKRSAILPALYAGARAFALASTCACGIGGCYSHLNTPNKKACFYSNNGIDYVGMLSRLCPSLGRTSAPNGEDFPELGRVVVARHPIPSRNRRITGICLVRSSFRIFRQSSIPSICGMLISLTTSCGCAESTFRQPSFPSDASIIL